MRFCCTYHYKASFVQVVLLDVEVLSAICSQKSDKFSLKDLKLSAKCQAELMDQSPWSEVPIMLSARPLFMESHRLVSNSRPFLSAPYPKSILRQLHVLAADTVPSGQSSIERARCIHNTVWWCCNHLLLAQYLQTIVYHDGMRTCVRYIGGVVVRRRHGRLCICGHVGAHAQHNLVDCHRVVHTTTSAIAKHVAGACV